MKTDRRDVEKLVRCYRVGELTAICVPDETQAPLRGMVRARIVKLEKAIDEAVRQAPAQTAAD